MAIDETGKVTFTEAEQIVVDRIVGERLDREKAKYEGHDDLKELVPLLQEFGFEGSPAEIKAALRAEAEGRRKQAELEALKDEADKTGSDPTLLAKIDRLEKQLAGVLEKEDLTKKEQAARTQAQEAWNVQVSEFTEKHGDIDLEKLGQNEKFVKFHKRSNPNLTLTEVYEDFVEMIGGAEAEAIAKMQLNIDRSTSSGRTNAEHAGATHGLTDNQQRLAKENGMTYKEYAAFLSEIL